MSTTLEATPVSDHERKAKRKPVHAQIAKLRKDVAKGLQLGRDMAANKKRVTELDLSSKEAVILGRDSSVFDAERRKIEDLLRHQLEAWKSLSGASGTIASLQCDLRGVLGCPQIKTDLFIAKRASDWAGKRHKAAQDQLNTVTGGPDDQQWQAEADHARQLCDEAAAEVERLKAAILAE